jgi:ssDNA-binding replication factor A large subunit
MLVTLIDGVHSGRVGIWTEYWVLIVNSKFVLIFKVMLVTVLDGVQSGTLEMWTDFRVLIINSKCV